MVSKTKINSKSLTKTTKYKKTTKSTKSTKSIKSSIDYGTSTIKNIDLGITPYGVKWSKTGSTGDEALDIYLGMNQTIIVDKHSLLFMDGEAKFDTQLGSVTKAIGRMFSGETAFLNYITGTNPNKLQRVNLGMSIQGDIVYLPIEYGKKWRISKGAFLAGTSNTLISSITKTGFKNIIGGIFSGEGIILSELSSSEGNASAWITTYGHIVKHTLKEGEILYVNNNLFLAADSNVNYSMKRIGNIKSIIGGGEVLVMKFTGPCEIYTQSRDFSGLISLIKPYLSPCPDCGRKR